MGQAENLGENTHSWLQALMHPYPGFGGLPASIQWGLETTSLEQKL